ncbi:MAG: hypothetical protein LBV73_25000 [Paraburkholderia sp.]|jgi:hypothetical protein|nr:hypothetical protein [Paraburkholderia sp.]
MTDALLKVATRHVKDCARPRRTAGNARRFPVSIEGVMCAGASHEKGDADVNIRSALRLYKLAAFFMRPELGNPERGARLSG